MRRAIRATTFAVVAFGAMTAPAAAAVFVGSTGGRIDIADGGASSIRYGVSAGLFLLYASPAPTPSAGCTTTTDPNVVTCPMAGIALVNFALGSGSSLDRAVGDSGPALHAEAARAAQHALSSLPERERRALVLRALGLPHRDVAASLGVSPLRARKLAAAARRELGARVAAGDGGEPCASTASSLRAMAAGWKISAPRRARLDAHLDACPACRGTLVALRREGALAIGPIVIAAPGWWQQVLASSHRAFQGALGRGGEAAVRGGEIATGGGAVGGGAALVGKLAAGCAAVCLVGGGVAVVAEQTGGDRHDQPRATARSADSTPLRATTIAAPVVDLTIYRPAKASFYGPGFFGRETACGQLLTPDLHGVAHRSLPCGTLVEIMYRDREITVPVIDRGPFSGTYSWDLTQATADALGFQSSGSIGYVRADRAPAAAPPAAEPPAS